MSMLKKLGKAFGGLFFVVSLSIVVMLMAMIQFFDYSTLKPLASNLISSQLLSQSNISSEQLEEFHAELVKKCTGDTYELPMGEQNVTVNCTEVRSETPQDVVKTISGSIFDSIYNKKYDCELMDCLKQQNGMEGYAVLLKTQEFLKGILSKAIVALALSSVVLFVSLEGTIGKLKGFGSSLIIVGISYFIFPITKNILPFPEEVKTAVSPLLNQIFDSLGKKMIIIFVVGVVLFAAGYFLERRQKSEKQ